MAAQAPQVGQTISREGRISEETEAALREALDLFNRSWE
jgi:hypothetical protein